MWNAVTLSTLTPAVGAGNTTDVFSQKHLGLRDGWELQWSYALAGMAMRVRTTHW